MFLSKGVLKKSSVCVFNMNTLNESMILTLTADKAPDVDEIGPQYCGRTVYVGWPHLVEARVVAVASRHTKYSAETDANGEPVVAHGKPLVHRIEMGAREADEWRLSEKEIKTKYANRWGVDIGHTQLLVYASPVIGRKYVFTQSGRITLEKQWSPASAPFAFQATVKELQVKEVVGHQYANLSDVFPPDSVVFMLGQPGYGSLGRVRPAPARTPKDKELKGKVRVEFENVREADEPKRRWLSAVPRYMPGHMVAQRLGISGHLVSRITGTVYLVAEGKLKKLNVGLALKFNKMNQEMPGWSRKSDGAWLYSDRTRDVLRQYIDEFPELFDFLSANTADEFYSAAQVFGAKEKERLAELLDFLETLPCAKAERQVPPSFSCIPSRFHWSCALVSQPYGSASIEEDTLKDMVASGPPKQARQKPLVMSVRPHLLYKPDLSTGSAPADASTTYELLDRVVNVRQGHSVPLGLRGTVIGIRRAAKSLETVYEVLFDDEFQGGLPVRGLPEGPRRVYHLPSWAMINLTHGRRQTMEHERPTGVVHSAGRVAQRQEPVKSQPRPSKTYKAAAESQPVGAKAAPQPRILARTRTSNGGTEAPKHPGGRGPTRTAPDVPTENQATPFMEIWNKLLEQSNEMQLKQAADGRPAQPKKQGDDQAAKVPSLQVPLGSTLYEARCSLYHFTGSSKDLAESSQASAGSERTNGEICAGRCGRSVGEPARPATRHPRGAAAALAAGNAGAGSGGRAPDARRHAPADGPVRRVPARDAPGRLPAGAAHQPDAHRAAAVRAGEPDAGAAAAAAPERLAPTARFHPAHR